MNHLFTYRSSKVSIIVEFVAGKVTETLMRLISLYRPDCELPCMSADSTPLTFSHDSAGRGDPRTKVGHSAMDGLGQSLLLGPQPRSGHNGETRAQGEEASSQAEGGSYARLICRYG